MSELANLKAGDKFFYRNDGYGLTSYERGDDAIEIHDGKLFTDTFDKIGMEWDGKTWVFDGGLGIKTSIVAADDPRALAQCED